MEKTSLKDIAHKLGISNATVSLVLNGKAKEGRVSKAMAEKIRKTASELNYQPNNLARSLRTGRSQTLAFIVADISNPFFASMALYVQKEAEKRGYSLIIANTDEKSEQMDSIIRLLSSKQVDGFLIVPTENGENTIKRLIENNTPFVLLDRYFPSIDCNFIATDNYNISREATAYLINKGCKKIALYSYLNNLPHMAEREKGYSDALKEAGLYDASYIKRIRYTNIYNEMEESIKTFDKMKYDGIFFVTNTLALSGLKLLSEKGFRLQKDINVVCFDKNDAFSLIPTPIPYIKQPIEQIGQKAVQILIESIESKNIGLTQLKLPAVFINS